MFATKGRLKVTLLVVGILVVGLGMYAAFQVQEADAHKPDPILYYDLKDHEYKWKDMSTGTTSGTCSYCGHSTTIHRTRVREECWNRTKTYHRVLGYHHKHLTSLKWARYYWRIDSVTCSNSSCGG